MIYHHGTLSTNIHVSLCLLSPAHFITFTVLYTEINEAIINGQTFMSIRNHLEDLDVDGEIILWRILEKEGGKM